jgi:hypothetical protein
LRRKEALLEVGIKKQVMTCHVNGLVTAKALSQISTGYVPFGLQRKRTAFTIREMLTNATVLGMIS